MLPNKDTPLKDTPAIPIGVMGGVRAAMLTPKPIADTNTQILFQTIVPVFVFVSYSQAGTKPFSQIVPTIN